MSERQDVNNFLDREDGPEAPIVVQEEVVTDKASKKRKPGQDNEVSLVNTDMWHSNTDVATVGQQKAQSSRESRHLRYKPSTRYQ